LHPVGASCKVKSPAKKAAARTKRHPPKSGLAGESSAQSLYGEGWEIVGVLGGIATYDEKSKTAHYLYHPAAVVLFFCNRPVGLDVRNAVAKLDGFAGIASTVLYLLHAALPAVTALHGSCSSSETTQQWRRKLFR